MGTIGSVPNPKNIVTMRQARLALLAQPAPSGTGTLLDATNAAITAATASNPALPIWWDYATTVQIDDPLVYQLGTALGLTQDQVAALFTQAATL